jgi:mannosyltransferase OCH1-like enzyme
MIPKCIHQIWLQGEKELPNRYIPFRQSIRDKHPDWEIKLWDDTKMIDFLKQNDHLIENYSLVQTYQNYKYLHQKVDFFRYVLLYIQGGVYIDMDCEALRCLDPILEEYNSYDMIICKLNLLPWESFIFAQNSTLLNNGVILAKPKCEPLFELIKETLKDCHCHSFLRKFKICCINFTTGPSKFTKVLLPYSTNKIKVLSSEYFEPCVMKNCNITENTFLYHKQDNTWVSEPLQKVMRFYSKTKWVIFIILFLLIVWLTYKFLY